MKYLLVLFFFLGNWAMNCQTIQIFSLEIDGEVRAYRQYTPAIYDGIEAVPVVFNFHGHNSTAGEQELYTDFESIADTANFIIVFPQGLIDSTGTTIWHDFTSMEDLEIDLIFFDAILANLNLNYTIDMNRIYSTGMSNGGFFSFDLACQRNEVITAIATVGGTMVSSHYEACNAQNPTPVMHFHGTSDDVVYYEGNGGVINAMGAEEIVQSWVEFNQCNEEPVYTEVPDINSYDNCTAEQFVYTDGIGGSSVEFFKINSGGHTWPGAFPLMIFGNTNQDIDACIEIWRFFRQYSSDHLVSIEEEQSDNSGFNIYPNPTNGNLIVEGEGIFGLFDLTGKKIITHQIQGRVGKILNLDFSPGLYIYQFQNSKEERYISGKLIIE